MAELLSGGGNHPTIYPFRSFAQAGGLLSHGINILDQLRRSAFYVDQILRGARPGDLPVQAPTKFELVINLKTAKARVWVFPRRSGLAPTR
jgi:putative tryptophan/tyrosine transport system substrate-binding protein